MFLCTLYGGKTAEIKCCGYWKFANVWKKLLPPIGTTWLVKAAQQSKMYKLQSGGH